MVGNSTTVLATLPVDVAALVSTFCVLYLGLVLTLSIGFIRYFDGHVVSQFAPKVVSVTALVLASVPAALIPVDVFIVSYMKDSTGQFRSWAQDPHVRQDVQNTVLYSYYVAYIVVLLAIFLALPMAYFYYDEKSAVLLRSSRRFWNAIGMTFIYVFILFVVSLAGDLIPPRSLPAVNSSDWELVKNVADELETTHWENVFGFVLAIVHLIGMILLTVYVASGMAAAPVKQLRGYDDPREDLARVVDRRSGVEIEIGEIRRMQHDQPEQSEATSTEQNRLFQLEHEFMNLRAEEEELRMMLADCLAPVVILTRPVQIVAGMVGAAIGFFLFASLAMSNICRAMNSLGEHWGYMMPYVGLMNLPDRLLILFQKLFPLDYAVQFIFTCYLAYYAISGIRCIGLGIPKLKVYKIETWNTKVNSLLAMIMTLVLILSSLDLFYLYLMPQYVHYGLQTYACSNATFNMYPPLPVPLPDSTPGALFHNDGSDTRCASEETVVPCDWDAPADQCVMSRIGVIWSRVFFNYWYFGVLYHGLSWIFLAVVIIEAMITLLRAGRNEETNSMQEDP